MTNIERTTTLRYTEGSSDKQYIVQIEGAGAGFNVVASWGRTGSALQTAIKNKEPLSREEAYRVADKLLNEKRRKDYRDTDGTVSVVGADRAGRDTGYRPMLLEPIDQANRGVLMTSGSWCLQEKYDGHHRMLILDGASIIAVNRNGLEVPCHQRVAEAAKALQVNGLTVIDGEEIDGVFAPFDLLVCDGVDLRQLPYVARLDALTLLIADVPAIPKLRTAFSTSEKQAFYDECVANNVEGVVFKRVDGAYVAGKSGKASTVFKEKFTESVTCRVVGQVGAKRSISLELFDAGKGEWIGVGNCTVPVNHEVPAAGSLAEVVYLYAMPNGGSLIQPQYKGCRTDVDEADCTTAQLKYKAERDFSIAA